MNDYEARFRDNPQPDCIFFVTGLNFLRLVCHTVLLLLLYYYSITKPFWDQVNF